MRGSDAGRQVSMFVLSPEEMIPADHPIRRIRRLVDAELAALDGVFEAMYSAVGRPSIPPERLLRAQLLIALYTVRSERQFCERLRYDFLFRWFVGLDPDEVPFDASTFSQNRERLIRHDAAGRFFRAVVERAGREGLISDEHFSVDGTLIEAWASFKSLKPRDDADRKDDGGDRDGSGPGDSACAATPQDAPAPPRHRNAEVDFRGRPRGNETHRSATDPEALLARKSAGKEARLAFAGHALMENRNGLCVDVRVTRATGTAERDAGAEMVRDHKKRCGAMKTVGADKGYDTPGFVEAVRAAGVTPHVAAKAKGSAIDARTTRHAGYAASQWCRKRIECIFGWLKTIGGLRKTRFRGTDRTGLWAYLSAAAYNLVRMARLLPA